MFWLLFNFHVLTVTLGVSGFFYCYSFLLSLLVSTLFSLVQLSLSLSFCSPRISPFMFSLSLFQKWLVVPFLFYFDRCLSVSLSSPVSDPNQHCVSVYLPSFDVPALCWPLCFCGFCSHLDFISLAIKACYLLGLSDFCLLHVGSYSCSLRYMCVVWLLSDLHSALVQSIWLGACYIVLVSTWSVTTACTKLLMLFLSASMSHRQRS